MSTAESYEKFLKNRTAVLTKQVAQGILKKPRSRGDSGALYLQSALAGVMLCRGYSIAELPFVSGDDVWVLRNRNLRTVSGQECSSTKWNLLCAARLPELS